MPEADDVIFTSVLNGTETFMFLLLMILIFNCEIKRSLKKENTFDSRQLLMTSRGYRSSQWHFFGKHRSGQ